MVHGFARIDKDFRKYSYARWTLTFRLRSAAQLHIWVRYVIFVSKFAHVRADKNSSLPPVESCALTQSQFTSSMASVRGPSVVIMDAEFPQI
jgi:hypothetical protein